MNRILGGSKGYLSGTWISSLNVPPSYGVPDGPCITAARAVCVGAGHFFASKKDDACTCTGKSGRSFLRASRRLIWPSFGHALIPGGGSCSCVCPKESPWKLAASCERHCTCMQNMMIPFARQWWKCKEAALLSPLLAKGIPVAFPCTAKCTNTDL